jgi:multiple sugar transport system substrate-binding protein
MNRTSARRAAVALLAAGAFVLAGCSTSASQTSPTSPTSPTRSAASFSPVPANQKVSLTMVSYLPLISPEAKSALNELISGFEAAHPNISVTVQTTAATTGAATAAVVQRDEAAGSTPDVVQSGLDMLRYLATGGLGAQDLGQVAGVSSIAQEWGGANPYPAAIQNLGMVNGKLYAIPWVLSTPILFYNATLFTKAGLNPSKPPTTWDQVQADALAIKKATGADGLSSCAAGESSSDVDWCTQAVILSNGGTVTSSNGETLDWTDPATVAAVAELGRLAQSGAMVNLTTAQTVEEFLQGHLAMVLNSSAAESALFDKGKIKLMDTTLPSFGSQPSVPTNSGSALAILSKTSLKQRASWELIQYLTSDAAYKTITTQIGYAPLRTSLANDLGSGSAVTVLTKPNIEQLNRLVAWQAYPGPNFGQVEKLLEGAVSAVAFQNQPAASALNAAQQQATGLLSP